MRKVIADIIKDLQKTSRLLPPLLVLNILVIIFQFVYLILRFKYINNEIPFWYTKPWGDQQLATKIHIFLIPVMSVIITSFSLYFTNHIKNQFLRYGEYIILLFITMTNLLLTGSLLRIIMISSTPFAPLIYPELLDLIVPFSIALIIVHFVTPKFIEFTEERGLITNPQLHHHPGMILSKPSARGGGAVFVIGFILTSILFTRFSVKTLAIFVAVLLAAGIGIMDDYQNTHPTSKLRIFENPKLRLILQTLIVIPILLAGIQINFVGNPLNGIITFDQYTLSLAGQTITPIPILITLVWILWIINLLSWSNGVDGQFSGIVGIAAIVIAIIAIKLNLTDPIHKDAIKLAMIAAGASLGLLPHTWSPSKIMWGFGAISAGVILSTISIITEAKIAASIIVLLIPFLDGSIAIIRRVLQGKSPFKGDRRHLHHLLIERGWSVKRVAVFYWITTAITGTVGILSSQRDLALTVLTLSGAGAFLIILLNLKSTEGKQVPQQSE